MVKVWIIYTISKINRRRDKTHTRDFILVWFLRIYIQFLLANHN